MALFFPHIKGGRCDSDKNLKYTFIDFRSDDLPHVFLNNKEEANDKGAIVTTNNINSFLANQFFNGGFTVNNAQFGSYLVNASENQFILSYKTSAETSDNLLIIDNTSNPANAFKFLKSITAPDLIATNKCEAVFFNATSDKRAKTDIKYLNINALDLINKVRIYSFEYKDTYEPSIGVIAQELQNINIQGFNLVDNIYASGENGNYMRVKETKLIYILWKGIQELNEEVQILRSEVERLKFER